MSRHIIIKMVKVKNKRIIKASRKNKTTYYIQKKPYKVIRINITDW